MDGIMSDSTPTTTYEFFLGLADRFGVPVLILGALLYMAREAAVSLNTTLLHPIVESHTKFLDATQDTLKEISRTQDKQADALQELANGQRDIHAAIKAKQSELPN